MNKVGLSVSRTSVCEDHEEQIFTGTAKELKNRFTHVAIQK